MTGITAIRPPSSSLRRPTVRDALAIFGITCAVILVLLVVPRLDGPNHIDGLTVSNPTDYDVRIATSSGGGTLLTPLATITAGATTTYDEVIDEGDLWVFRFWSQGRAAGQVSVSRQDLEADNWTLRIPDSVGRDLRADGVPLPR